MKKTFTRKAAIACANVENSNMTHQKKKNTRELEKVDPNRTFREHKYIYFFKRRTRYVLASYSAPFHRESYLARTV